MSLAKNGRLESQAMVLSSAWTGTLNEGGGAVAWSISPGTYSPTTLATALAATLTAAGGSYTVSIANGEAGTGKVTIAEGSSTVFTLNWTSTAARDFFGFTGNLSGSATYTSTYGVLGLWLPDCILKGAYVSGDEGHWEGGPSQTVSPLGATMTLLHPTRVRIGPVVWSHVSAARSRQYSETSGVRSFERFVRDTMFGQTAGFTPGGTVRLYWDAGAGGYVDINPEARETTELGRAVEEYGGLYACSIAGWKVPA